MLPLLLACQQTSSPAYVLLVPDEADTATDTSHAEAWDDWVHDTARAVNHAGIVVHTALWAPLGGRPVARPKALDQAVAKWLEEAREPALDKLWTLSGGGR